MYYVFNVFFFIINSFLISDRNSLEPIRTIPYNSKIYVLTTANQSEKNFQSLFVEN